MIIGKVYILYILGPVYKTTQVVEMYNKIPQKDHLLIITDYLTGYRSVKTIADFYGVSRQGVNKVLCKYGVNGVYRRYTRLTCAHCGVEYRTGKASAGARRYCSRGCYSAALSIGNGMPYIDDTHARRRAREIVAQHFDLQPGNVVHHEDRNSKNNNLNNLSVFAGQGDHVRYHRCGNVVPIWRGADVH